MTTSLQLSPHHESESSLAALHFWHPIMKDSAKVALAQLAANIGALAHHEELSELERARWFHELVKVKQAQRVIESLS